MDPWARAEKELEEWVSVLNGAIGVLSFTIATTAITSSYPEEIASIAFVFMTLWGFSKGKPFRKPIQRHTRHSGVLATDLVLFGGSYIFILGYSSLALVAFGFIEAADLQGLSFANLFFGT
ncbi:hypothetical protein [Thiorhodococcus drewsii]|uniref:hypothetical protein n=1 Tax=Thiorhodococcus drewsii TaxID=210408 RepID=UPI000594C9AA|nr:hypothetical protein [Thiorhodococcus drewsii]